MFSNLVVMSQETRSGAGAMEVRMECVGISRVLRVAANLSKASSISSVARLGVRGSRRSGWFGGGTAGRALAVKRSCSEEAKAQRAGEQSPFLGGPKVQRLVP